MTDGGSVLQNGFGFQWHITWRCAAKCTHCYQSDSDSTAEPDLDDLKNIAACIMGSVQGPVTINITGGEPLMYRQHGNSRGVFDLMAYLSTFGNLGELNIITSTLEMDSQALAGLKSLPKLDYVKVSLESDDRLINDSIRGNGHYQTVVENIKKLVGSGLRVIIMATLSKLNYKSVSGLCTLAVELGTHGVIFERFVPLGRGADGMGGSVLAIDEWRQVLSAIACFAGVSADDLLPYKAFWVNADAVSGAPCCLGSGSMALMPDGTVYPCRRFPLPAGKLPDDKMEKILAELSGYSSSPQRCFEFGF